MSRVREIVFADEGQNIAPNHQEQHQTVSVDGWFEGYGDMFTVEDLAAIFHVSRKTVQKQCRRGDLPAISIGRRWYVPKAHLVEFLMSGSKLGVGE